MSKTIALVAEAIRAVCDRDSDLGPLAEKVRVLALQARDEHDSLKAALADLRAVVEEALALDAKRQEYRHGFPVTHSEGEQWRKRAKAALAKAEGEK